MQEEIIYITLITCKNWNSKWCSRNMSPKLLMKCEGIISYSCYNGSSNYIPVLWIASLTDSPYTWLHYLFSGAYTREWSSAHNTHHNTIHSNIAVTSLTIGPDTLVSIVFLVKWSTREQRGLSKGATVNTYVPLFTVALVVCWGWPPTPPPKKKKAYRRTWALT